MVLDLMEELRVMAEDHDDELCGLALFKINQLEAQVKYFQDQYVLKTDIELQLRKLLKECEEAR